MLGSPSRRASSPGIPELSHTAVSAIAEPPMTSRSPVRAIKLTAVLVTAKLAGRVSRLLRRGDGQALPGLVADALMPELAAILAGQFRQGVVIVTGTTARPRRPSCSPGC